MQFNRALVCAAINQFWTSGPKEYPDLATVHKAMGLKHLRIRHTAILCTMDTILLYDNDNNNKMTITMITMTVK